MNKLLILSLIIIAALEDVAKPGVFAFKWKSSSLFPNGTVIQACVGDNVTFPWMFDMMSPTQVVIQWSKTSKNKPDREKLSDLALYSSDIFHELSPERSLEFLPNAGIKLPKVTLADEGFYKVEIILFGHPESYKQVAFLHVIDVPVITSDELHAFILPESVYNSTTGLWHVQLGCRHPVTRGQKALPVIWTTPSNRTAISTSYNNNTFILTLPSPVEEGDYSCSLNLSVPAVKCLSSHLNTRRSATVNVKGMNTRLSLLDRSVETLWIETANLNGSLYNLSDIVQHLQTNDKKCDEEVTNLNQRTVNISSALQNLQTKNYKMTATVERNNDNIRALVQSKFDNITAMVQSKIDGITAMVQSKFDNLNAIVLQLQSGLSHVLCMDSVHRPASCVDVQKYDNVSGVHIIFVNDNRPVKVYCDQSTDNGGWTVIQRRQDGSVDFYRNWEQYEKGFGDLNGEFWIGLANLYHLTTNNNSKLRVDLTDFDGSTAYAMYNTFSISGAQDYYQLNVDGYSGTAGDSMEFQNKMKFTTFDQDHDTWSNGSCAQDWHGAWWYNICHKSNLNGLYKSSGVDNADGVNWYFWRSDYRSFKRVEMKIKQ